MKKKSLPFGTLLRTARERAGLSQSELARQCEVKPQRINALEQGTRDNPGLDTINRLADALGITAIELLSGKSREKATA